MTRRFFFATLLLTAVFSQTGEGYLRISTGVASSRVFVRSPTPTMRYFVNPTEVSGVNGEQLQSAVARAAETWQAVPTSAVSFQFVGTTGNLPGDVDGQNTIGFLNEPELEGFLGITFITFDTVTGDIIEADVMFNSVNPFSVAADGEPDRYDVEALAVHEMAHMFGLSHSGLAKLEGGGVVAAETVMFPLSFNAGTIAEREPKADDIAGASVIYPDGGFEANTGTISGRVQLPAGPVFGAHVMAFHPGSGTMIAGFTYEDGGFLISGLSPGLHILRIEPLDDDPASYFVEENIEVAFTARYLDRLIPVQRSVTTPRVEIVVEPK